MTLSFEIIKKGRTDVGKAGHGALFWLVAPEIALPNVSVHRDMRKGRGPCHALLPVLPLRRCLDVDQRVIIAVISGDFRGRFCTIKIKPVRRANLVFDLVCDARVILEEHLGVFTPLPDPLIAV